MLYRHQSKLNMVDGIIILVFALTIPFTAGCIDKGHKDLTLDMWILKTDMDGNLQWTAAIDNDPNGRGQAMIQTHNGGFAVVGTGTDASGNAPVPRVVTIDAGGNIISKVTFGNPPDYGSSIVEAKDGGYVVAGYSGVLTRVNESGSVFWSTSLGGGSDWWQVVRVPDGGYAVAGNNRVIRVGEDGTTAWTATFEPDYKVRAIIMVASGGVIAGGVTGADVWIAMLDAEGGTVWSETIGSPLRDEFYIVRISPVGEYNLIFGTALHTVNETSDMWITETTTATLTADGILVGERPTNVSRVIVATEDGGYAYSGFVVPRYAALQPLSYPGSPLHVIRLDSEGAVLWDASYDIGDDTSVVSIIQTKDGGFVVLGSAYDF
jgi:hypothetical protein